MKLVRMNKYKDVYKNSNSTGAASNYRNDVDFVYQDNLRLEKVLPLSAKV